jgi:phospholipid/cholesterol/gamma-HCH transport system permease protein
MSSAAARPLDTPIHQLGRAAIDLCITLGDLTLFGLQTLLWLVVRRPSARTLWPLLLQVGVASLPVVLVTGAFIGLVLAVQAYDQFKLMHMENQLGAVINVSLVKELGPVLAAVMLAGRVGSAMAAELGTMRVTEQIDALTALGANPVAYLVGPRFLACFLLIPILTLFADGVGVVSGWAFSTLVLGVEDFPYWHYSKRFVTGWELATGVLKSVFFGAAIAIVACHRGFHASAGAEGVGRAATEAFVFAFVSILAIDFLLGTLLMRMYFVLWPM